MPCAGCGKSNKQSSTKPEPLANQNQLEVGQEITLSDGKYRVIRIGDGNNDN